MLLLQRRGSLRHGPDPLRRRWRNPARPADTVPLCRCRPSTRRSGRRQRRGNVFLTRRIVVVGAGAGGCVAAARLFDAGYEVHLFEAGEASATNSSPRLADSTSRTDLLDGSVFASTYTGGFRYPYLRGRALGGTTAINALVQMWGTKDDWDAWSAMHGCTGWNWRSVSAEIALLGLPSHFASASESGPVTGAVLSAARGMGASECRHTGETYDGAGRVALSLRDGRRADAFSVFVTPRALEDAGRMVVHAGESVAEIAVEADRARGIVVGDDEFVADGVVLAAGTVWSPILLRWVTWPRSREPPKSCWERSKPMTIQHACLPRCGWPLICARRKSFVRSSSRCQSMLPARHSMRCSHTMTTRSFPTSVANPGRTRTPWVLAEWVRNVTVKRSSTTRERSSESMACG
ncbi:MAG: GMC family oxidoreductase [Actinobacteria bacterium]|nr:GMC family oxidoreductase [Actinomycetota bacterium]